MVKINKLLLLSLLSIGAWDSNAAEINTNIARLQAMDKITGMVRVFDAPVNSEVKYGSFSVVVRACKTRPPEETPENFAFVDVVDDYNGKNPVNIFRGWMVSSSPSLNPVEHPIYDIWLLKCVNGNVPAQLKIMTAEELTEREKIPQKKENKSDTSRNEEVQTEADVVENNSVEKTVDVLENNDVVEQSNALKEVLPSKQEDKLPALSVENNGPQSLINVNAEIPEVETPQNNIKQEENNNVANVKAEVVISEVEEKTTENEQSPQLLKQEPTVEQIDELSVEENLEVDEVEENGMLEEQLIDFSE